MPFLENVTRGRGIPRERLAAVAEHYLHFGGVSPINGINRALIGAAGGRTGRRGHETCRCTSATGTGSRTSRTPSRRCATTVFGRAAVFTTSAWGGYSSCTQYNEDIARGRDAAGDRRPRTGQAAAVLRPPVVRRDVRRVDRTMRPRRCPRSCAPRRGWCSPRTRSLGRRIALRYGPLRQAGRLRIQARRRQGRIRRLRPGVAVALRATAGSLAGTGCGGTSFGAGGRGHQGRHRLSDRLRRRPHRGGVGSRQRAARAGRRSAASPSQGRPRRTPTAGSRDWPWT